MVPHLRASTAFRSTMIVLLVFVLRAGPSQAAWPMHAGNPQHTALSTVPTQSLQAVHWQMPVDLKPQYSGNTLFIHYGSPVITEANTVIVPVKVGAADTFRVEARRGSDGLLLWQLPTDYQLPSHSWVPSVGLTLAHPDRVYLPGAGGTLLWTNGLDTPAAHTTVRAAFFGNAAYAANPAAFNASLRVCTPLTADSRGTVYFGVQAVLANPLGITNAIAAVDESGVGRWVSVGAASGGQAIQVATNCAPALSRDEQTLYIACRGNNSTPGYLVALSTSDLSTQHVRPLVDPLTGLSASVSNNGTATPMIAPDDKVYYGVLENPFGANAARGWMLQFDAALSPAGAAGAFGWDHTPSLVPAAAAPVYSGTSPYLIMTKYNFYVGSGGNGENRIAVLDPLATQIDGFSGLAVMNEVATILGATPDPDAGPSYPTAVKEWCINTALVDPYRHSVLAGAEDGKLYRWDLATNTLTETLVLTPGLGEAYTPTVSGPDGQVYAINNATLFAVGASNAGAPPAPVVRTLQLAPPSPNPFSTRTRFAFGLPSERHVRLEVLDVAGALVRTLADRHFDAGEHGLEWDGRNGAGNASRAGVYFVRLTDGSSTLVRKVLLTP